MNKSILEEQPLSLAIFQAVQMWGNPRYKQFLRKKKPEGINEAWFNWFVVDWRVVRNIKKAKNSKNLERENVRRYLDTKFRQRLTGDGEGKAVEKAARHIQQMQWSAGKSGKACLPTSLVSKIGFFLKPNVLIPYDRLGRQGLKKCGVPRVTTKSYTGYLKAFNHEFNSAKKEIRNALRASWVKIVAKKFLCPIRDLKSPAFQRKLFDNYLMAIGRQNSDET